MIDFGLWIGYILLLAGAGGMLVFSTRNMLRSPKNAKSTLMGVGGILVLFLLSWLISSSSMTPKMVTPETAESSSKMIGAGFIMLYIMGLVSLGAIFYTEIKKAFSKK